MIEAGNTVMSVAVWGFPAIVVSGVAGYLLASRRRTEIIVQATIMGLVFNSAAVIVGWILIHPAMF